MQFKRLVRGCGVSYFKKTVAIYRQNLSQFPDAKAACLLVHGLNNKPQVLLDIAQLLESMSLPMVMVSLTGHQNDFEKLNSISKEAWTEDVLEGYDLIKSRFEQIYLIGFSLGGSIGLDIISSSRLFDKMILLAPAIAPRIPVRLLEYISPILPSLPLYSLAPENYIANKYLPLKAYEVLLDIFKSVHKKQFAHANVPTLLIADPKDETMSLSDIRKLMVRFKLSNWKVLLLNSDNVVSKVRFHHLIIDREAMGLENWDEFKRMITAHLRD